MVVACDCVNSIARPVGFLHTACIGRRRLCFERRLGRAQSLLPAVACTLGTRLTQRARFAGNARRPTLRSVSLSAAPLSRSCQHLRPPEPPGVLRYQRGISETIVGYSALRSPSPVLVGPQSASGGQRRSFSVDSFLMSPKFFLPFPRSNWLAWNT